MCISKPMNSILISWLQARSFSVESEYGFSSLCILGLVAVKNWEFSPGRPPGFFRDLPDGPLDYSCDMAAPPSTLHLTWPPHVPSSCDGSSWAGSRWKMTSGPQSFSGGHIQSLSVWWLGWDITLFSPLHGLMLSSLFGKYLAVERLAHVWKWWSYIPTSHVGEFWLVCIPTNSWHGVF